MRLNFIMPTVAAVFLVCSNVVLAENPIQLIEKDTSNTVQSIGVVPANGARILRSHKTTQELEERIVAQMFSKTTDKYVKSRLDIMLGDPSYATQKFKQWYNHGLSDDVINAVVTSQGTHFKTLYDQYLVWAGRTHGVA